jgi:hypothetical protein
MTYLGWRHRRDRTLVMLWRGRDGRVYSVRILIRD